MINKIKSISKRTLAMVLTLLMLLSSGIVGTLAANVDLAPVGADLKGYIYYDNSLTKWSNVQLLIGHSSYSRGYKMTKIANTDLWYYNMSSTWGGATQIAVFNASSTWGEENNSVANRVGYMDQNSACKTFSTSYTSGLLLYGTSGSDNFTLSMTSKTYSTLNTDQTATVQSAEAGTSNFNNDAAAGSTTISTFKLSSATGSASSSGTTSASAARTAKVTMKATANDGYTFKGWYDSSGTLETTSTTLEYTCDGSAATYYARFEKESKATATFEDWDGTKLYEVEVEKGATPTYGGSTPTREGYTFTGWDPALGAIDGDKTYTAQYTANTYTITYLNYDGSTLGTGSAKYDTNVNAFNDAPTNPTRESTVDKEYKFATWVYEDGTPVGADDLIKGNITLVASYTESARSYTVNFSNPEGGTVAVTADGASIANGGSVPYGTVLTLTATPDKFYTVGTWSASAGTVTNNTYTVTGDVTLTHTFNAKTTYEIIVQPNRDCDVTCTCDGYDFELVDMDTYKVEAGAEITFDITAPHGWYIAKVGNFTNDNYMLTEYKLEVVADDDKYFSVIVDKLPEYEVTASVNDADAGTVTGGGTVYWGTKVNLTAIPNTGYKFTGWTYSPAGAINEAQVDLSQQAISFVPQEAVTFTANFVANKGTVNVSANDGGTVDTKGGDITYPETVTATATADTSNGYLFTHWTVKSDGIKGRDYEIVRENGNVIEIRILTDGTVVDVVANFANAQKIKIYTYTDSGFNKLHLTETKGTDTKDVYNSTQSAILFGNETWFTPTTGALTLTAGYNDAITAQLFSSAAETTDGTVIYVELSDAWTKTSYAYGAPHISVTSKSNYDSGWYDDITSNDTSGVNQNCYIPQNDTYIGGGVQVSGNIYKFVIPDTSLSNLKNYGFMVYSKQWTSADFWELNTTHGTYSASSNLYKISESNTLNNDRKTYCFSISASDNMPTQTDPINIVNALYNGNEWLGKEEVWIYFDSNGGYTVTNRRQLNNYVSTGIVKNAYNGGKNDKGYTDETWTAFVSAYKAAAATLGAGASSQDDIDNAYSTLKKAYEALDFTKTVTLIGSHGAEPYTNQADFYGKISFPGLTGLSTKTDGNIGDDNTNYYHYPTEYLTGSVDRGATIQINTQIQSDYLDDYVVYGWVVNGTEFVTATEDIATDGLYIGSYTCSNNATIVPIYFRADTIENWQENDNVVKVYAKITDNIGKWGNYISAYTWTSDHTMNTAYRQFGHWTGQLMIPDASTPGMYYTYVEKANPDDPDDPTTGITFVNYGNNNPINTNARYQAYDYYEFIELANQDFDNIVFELKTFEGNENYPSESKAKLSDYNFNYFTDFSGNRVDIARNELTEEQMALDPALYVVRTGPVKNNEGAKAGWGSLEGSDFYVDAYLYKPDGTYIGRCKTYELTNLEKLKETRKIDLTTEEYAGKPVMVDYASLTTDSGGNKRYDGEWYGTKYGFTNVTISVEVAFLNEDGTVTYYSDEKTPNDIEGVGSAYINGEATQELPHGSEGHVISANVPEGNDFVGWCIATKNGDGTITIDPASPLFIERSNTIDASSDAIYVAVFKAHPEGAFTVNNYYYTYDDFKGQTLSPYVPPVFGGDTSYSIRDVEIDRIYNSYTGQSNDVNNDRAGNYTQTLDSVNVGDILRITIYTKPTFPRDYVYAWYIQANDSYGVNFEEIGTTATNPSGEAAKEESFTFEYKVEEGVSNITIYSDVVHTTDIVTLTYIYTNRFNIMQKYIVKHKLTEYELTQNDYKPTTETIRNNAPKVDDLFKDLEWIVDEVQSDATNYTLRASEDDLFNVIVTINGVPVYDDRVRFNEPMEIKAYELVDDLDRSKPGIWYLDNGRDGDFNEGEDTILGYGQYYGLVVTGDANICYTDDYELMTQIVLADAVYGAEKVTDENGVETVNKVYVDYLISYLLNVFTGQYIDLDEDGVQDANEPTIYEANNVSNPVSVKAIREAGYTVDYGLVLELLNTFNEETKQSVLDTYYGKDKTLTDKIHAMLASDKSTWDVKKGWSDTGYADTHFYMYEAEDYGFNLTNKNRVIMTFGYENTEAMRNRYYNAMAYLIISDSNGENPNYWYSNQATLNIKEADNIKN